MLRYLGLVGDVIVYQYVLKLDECIKKNIEHMLSPINIGTGVDVNICELAKIMKQVIDFKGKRKFCSNKLGVLVR